MIRSMTAFARLETEHGEGSFVWEIRSVNHRYLEPSFRLSENFREIESPLREILRKRIARGKVELSLKVTLNNTNNDSLTINQSLAGQVIAAAESLQSEIKQFTPIDPLDVLRWPGVLETPEQDFKTLQQAALAQFEQLLSDFIAAREREGAELKAMINSRLEEMLGHVATVRSKIGLIVAAQKQKLKDKLAEAQVQADPERLEQEIVILAQKVDVDEEMDRLQTHIDEVKRVLKQGGPCGRRLDFLMQELNREANTLASKSVDAQTTQAAVELKVLIEQMREQVQNIE